MIDEINQIDQLSELRDDWNRLHRVTPNASFFQTLDWLTVYWKHFGQGQRLRVLVDRSEGEVSGIVPLVVRRERKRIGTLRILTYPLDYWGSFYSPLGRNPRATLVAGLLHLKHSRRDWDLLDLRWLGGTAHDCQSTAEALAAAGHRPEKRLLDQTSVIELPATWEAYLASRTSKWRNNWKRWERRTAELGKVSLLRYRPAGGIDGDPRWDLFDTCVRIAESSWQGESRDGTTLSHASINAFLRDTHQAAAACGFLDLNLMYIDHKPVAFGYNYWCQKRIFGMRVGYDPVVRAAGAGNLLYALMIEDACRRGDEAFDLGPGSLEAKRHLWTAVLPIYRLTCYRRFSLSQQLMRLKHLRDARRQETVFAADDN